MAASFDLSDEDGNASSGGLYRASLGQARKWLNAAADRGVPVHLDVSDEDTVASREGITMPRECICRLIFVYAADRCAFRSRGCMDGTEPFCECDAIFGVVRVCNNCPELSRRPA